MLYIGIDPSLTGTGLVRYCPKDKGCSVATVGNKNAATTVRERLWRYDGLLGEVLDWLREGEANVSGIAIEGYSFGSKGAGTTDRAEFGGILRHYLIVNRGYRNFIEVPPGTLKLFVIGKGVGDKSVVKLAAYKRWGVDFCNDNETDAYVLARIAACHFGAEEPDNDAQRRALKTLA